MTAVRTDHVTLDRVFRRWVRITQRVTAEQLHSDSLDSGSWTEASSLTGPSGPKLLNMGNTCAGLLTAPTMLTDEPTLSLTGQMLAENRRQMVEPQVVPEQLVIDNAEHERVPPSLRSRCSDRRLAHEMCSEVGSCQ